MCGALSLNAQVSIEKSPAVERLLTRFVQDNSYETNTAGYRIQLLASTDRRSVENELGRFRTLFPTINADWIHQSPYYRLHAGAYEDKWAAVRMLYVVKREYPSAFIMRDPSIRTRDFLN